MSPIDKLLQNRAQTKEKKFKKGEEAQTAFKKAEEASKEKEEVKEIRNGYRNLRESKKAKLSEIAKKTAAVALMGASIGVFGKQVERKVFEKDINYNSVVNADFSKISMNFLDEVPKAVYEEKVDGSMVNSNGGSSQNIEKEEIAPEDDMKKGYKNREDPIAGSTHGDSNHIYGGRDTEKNPEPEIEIDVVPRDKREKEDESKVDVQIQPDSSDIDTPSEEYNRPIEEADDKNLDEMDDMTR